MSVASFPCHATTPRRAREFCSQQLREALPPGTETSEVIDDCLLVVSELVTNAVKAGCTVVSLTVDVHRDHVRIGAHDDVPGEPRLIAASPRDRHGRGIAIVDSLAREWGVERESLGKQVWADVPIPSRLTFALECSL